MHSASLQSSDVVDFAATSECKAACNNALVVSSQLRPALIWVAPSVSITTKVRSSLKIDAQYEPRIPSIFAVRDPNGTKSSGSGIKRIICLGLGLAIAQQLVFTQNNVCTVASTFGQRNAIPCCQV